MRDSNLIRSADEIWNQISEVNNLEFEYLLLDGKVPVIVANDVYKNPDLVSEFFENLDYWETREIDNTQIIRPGLTHAFPDIIQNQIADALSERIRQLFGVSKLDIFDLYSQCTSGDMTLDTTGGLCCYPHIDVPIYDSFDPIPCFVTNINFSKSKDPVTTGFWSWRGKLNSLDFDRTDKNALELFYNRHLNLEVNSWFQMKDYEDFKLETSHTMGYNSLVMYPTTHVHNGYIEPEWFRDSQRLMLSTFYFVSPEDLDFEERNMDTVSYSWEHFRLDTLFNYHPKQTTLE